MQPTNNIHEDSHDPWRYNVVISKFMIEFIGTGILKSFGVLLPDLVEYYDSDFKTISFLCGLPLLAFGIGPLANFLVNTVTLQTMGIVGGVLMGGSITCAPMAGSIYSFGAMLALTGIGWALTYFPLVVSLNQYFPQSFVFAKTVAMFGTTCGAFILPVITERSLEAYGLHGAFLILGGITLHAMVAGAMIRTPRDISDIASTTEGDTRVSRNGTPESKSKSRHISKVSPTVKGDRRVSRSGRPESESQSRQSSKVSPTVKGDRRVSRKGRPESELQSEHSSGMSSTVEGDTKVSCHVSSRNLLPNEPESSLALPSFNLHTELGTHDMTLDSNEETRKSTGSRTASLIKSSIFVKEPLYTLIMPSIFLQLACFQGWMLYLVPHAEGFGISLSRAVFLSSIASIGGVLGRLFYLALLYFKHNSVLIFFISCLFLASTFFVDSISSTYLFLSMVAFLQGFFMFMMQSLPTAMLKISVRNEGNMSAAISVYMCPISLGALTGATVSGYIYDVTRSYSAVFKFLGGIILVVFVNLVIFAIARYEELRRFPFTRTQSPRTDRTK